MFATEYVHCYRYTRQSNHESNSIVSIIIEMSKCIALNIKSQNFYLKRNMLILEQFGPQNIPATYMV